MILTNLTLKDWKHLKHLRLADLAPGINVIHGPNKAGKTTLAEAVRIALVDYDHESGHREVSALTPMTDASAIPTAQVGFIAKNQSWTVEKRFTKRKGGGAELHQGDSKQLKAEGKNVTQEVVRLLGIAKSNEGLGALLWPKQGNATLPDVDQPLGDALRQLLGVQISDGDMGFQSLLDQRLESCFTSKGKPKVEVTRRKEEIEGQRKTVEDLRAKRLRHGELVAEHGDKKAEHIEAQKAVENTRKTIADLEPRVKALDSRKQRIKDIERRQAENTKSQKSERGERDGLRAKAEAVKLAEEKATEAELRIEPLKHVLDAREDELRQTAANVTALELQVQALAGRKTELATIEQQQAQNTKDHQASEDHLSELKTKAKAVADADKAATETAIGLKPLKQALERTEAALKEAGEKVVGAEADDMKLRELEARSKTLHELAELERALPTKRRDVDKARETEQQLAKLRQELAQLPSCDEDDRERLNDVLDELRDVEAGLRAAAITVTLKPEADTRAGIHADGESRDESLAAGSHYGVAVLHDAELRLTGWGTVHVKRGEAAVTLSKQRAQRDTLRAELLSLGVKLALGEIEQGKWVSELARRAATRERKDTDAKNLVNELKKQAPDGAEALAIKLERDEVQLANRKQVAGLLEAASVAEALDALGDLAARRIEADAALESARKERAAAQEAHDRASEERAEADKRTQELETKANAARELLKDAEKRTGGEKAVIERLSRLADAGRKLAEELDRVQLTEEEKRLPEDLKAARTNRDAAKKELDEAKAAHKDAVEVYEKAKTSVQAAQAVLEADVKRTGGEEAVNKQLEELVRAATQLQEELAGNQLTPEEERLEQTLTQERQAFETRQKREREISDRLKEIESKLDQFEGLHGQLAAAEQKLSAMQTAREREMLDADAHKLIAEWFKEELDKATEHSLAPVSEHVQRWLRILNNADGGSLEFNGSSLKAETMRVGDQSLPLDTVTSYGEREQLGTLVRLAYACVLAKDEPQAVVLDDPLAHSDSARHRRMLDVLADASKRNLQIIVLTCHPERFDQLTDAHHIDLEAAKAAGA